MALWGASPSTPNIADKVMQSVCCGRRMGFSPGWLPFSVLFAFDPARYRSSGYRLMTNETRFLDSDGRWKQLVYRGGMFAELGSRKWPNRMLDLRGRAL